MKSNFLGAVVLIAAGAIGASLARGGGEASAQSVDNKTTRWLTTTVEYGPNQQAMMLFDSQTNRLMAYTMTATKTLEIASIRDISWDMKATSFGKQVPTVEQLKADFEKAEKEKK